MLKKIEKFINSLGDFNHLFISMIIMIAVTIIQPNLLPYAATFLSAFYLGKEHWTYIRLGELGSFNMMKWASHDRNQTLYLWFGVWAYALLFDIFVK
jgi:hypothetical protein